MPRTPRTPLLVTSLVLVAAGLVPVASSASTPPSPRDEGRYVNLEKGEKPRRITPDAISFPNGKRVEVYGSVGDNEGGMDWRTINAFSHLIDSVPKDEQSYITFFNSLYDDRSISYVDDPANPGRKKFTIAKPDEVFAPTAALLDQVNQYDTPAQAAENIHVLGAKESMEEAWDANSSLARLAMGGNKSANVNKPGVRAIDYAQCSGKGGCLSSSDKLMHSKYAAFTQAADSDGNLHRNVVWITSSNLNGSSGSKKSNISIAIFDDAQAFDSVVNGIFEPSFKVAKGEISRTAALRTPRYAAALAIDPATRVMSGMPTDSGIRLFPSPRRESDAAGNTETTDVEAAFLQTRVAESTRKSGCKIYAVHSLFNSTRKGVKDGLGALDRQGCDVKLVLGENAIADLVDGYFNMSEDLRELVGKVEFANVHDKTLSYRDSTTATSFGGASNFTGTSLEYDELAFRADDLGVTQGVQDHSERIYQLGRGQTTWAAPSSVSLTPTTALQVVQGAQLQVATRVSPGNALVTETQWKSSNGAVASVDQNGLVTGKFPGTAEISATVKAPAARTQSGSTTQVTRTTTKTVKVVAADGSAKTTPGAGGRATIAPTLTMDNYQSPNGTTNAVVTWGSGGDQYDGVVKLQYYSGGWKTYGKSIAVEDGVGYLEASFSGSKTWRAYGARLDRINGKDVPNSTSKAMSKWSYNTVRTKESTLTPRLYATNLAKSGGKIPFLISWARGNGVVRLQMRSSGGSWKTHSTYRIPSGSSQLFIAVPALNTKYWRIATSTGTTKVSNTVKVSMR